VRDSDSQSVFASVVPGQPLVCAYEVNTRDAAIANFRPTAVADFAKAVVGMITTRKATSIRSIVEQRIVTHLSLCGRLSADMRAVEVGGHVGVRTDNLYVA
jgi:hypothetical protein